MTVYGPAMHSLPGNSYLPGFSLVSDSESTPDEARSNNKVTTRSGSHSDTTTASRTSRSDWIRAALIASTPSRHAGCDAFALCPRCTAQVAEYRALTR